MNFNRQQMTSLFPVDLGVDLRELYPEITQCKLRFQRDLWNTICNRVLQEQSGWKKGKGGGDKSGSKSEEKKSDEEGGGGGGGGGSGEEEPKEEEPTDEPKDEAEPEEGEKPEESGENENNEAMWANWNNVVRPSRDRRRVQQQLPPPPPPRQQQQRRRQQQPQPYRGPAPPPPRQSQFSNAALVRRRGLSAYQKQYQQPLPTRPPRPPPRQQLPQQQQPMRVYGGGGGSGGGGELLSFLQRIQPQEGVLDWRCGGPAGPLRLDWRQKSAAALTNGSHLRSVSATSKREILGDPAVVAAADEVDEAVEASDGVVDAQLVYAEVSGGGVVGVENGCLSDGDTATYYGNNAAAAAGALDGASQSTAGTREFVPLMVGNWLSGGGPNNGRQL